jgi:hypothetical protein
MLRREQSEQFRNLARQYCESAPGNEWPTLASAHLQDMAPHDGDGARCTFFAKDALEGWIHRLKVEKRLVDIEDDQGKSGHIAGLLSFASDLEFLGWSAPVLEPAAVRGGACTVFLDGKPLRSCSFPVSALGKVLQHSRCMNCHPAGERPRQTDLRRLHQPLVVRGKDGHGAPGMICATCHGGANFDPSRVPGDLHWALARASMAWEGKTAGEICASCTAA